jgi:type VI secretion system secreted protein VgrG
MSPPSDHVPPAPATSPGTGTDAAAALSDADAAAKASPTAGAAVGGVQPCPFEGIKIDGSPEFQRNTVAALKEIEATKSGPALLADLKDSKKTVTIKEADKGNSCRRASNDANVKADGTPGKGADSTVSFSPDKNSTSKGKRPPAIGLAHELIHAAHNAKGTRDASMVDNDKKPDPADPSKIAQHKKEEIRTVGIAPFDKEPYSENSLRSEWPQPQPPRPYY